MKEPLIRDGLISTPQDEYDALRFVSEEAPCPYLPGRQARSELYAVDELSTAAYEGLLSRGFRRSGRVVYRPRCRSCRECRQLRVCVALFARSRSMNRVWRLNRDVQVDVARPAPSNEKYGVFVRYLDGQHDRTMGRTRDAFEEFLYDTPTETLEFAYRLGTRLVGVSIADRVPSGLSSVYMYFEPSFARRSLGTFSILWEIEYVRFLGLPFYYLGYYVAESETMAYKARFRPNELLTAEHQWIRLRE